MTTPPESATDQVPTRARHGRAAHSRRCLPTIRRRATQAMIIIASMCGLVFTASQLLTQPNPTDIHLSNPRLGSTDLRLRPTISLTPTSPRTTALRPP